MTTTGAGGHVHRGYSDDREAVLKRLRRIEGQVRGIAKMVEDDRYCVDVLTQLAAVGGAVEGLSLQILEGHVDHCGASALASGDEADARAKAQELLTAVRHFARTR